MITTQTLQMALKKRKVSVKLTQAWKDTHHELGVGQIAGDSALYLGSDDYDRLQAEYDRRTNQAPLGFDFKQDRVQVAAQMPNEKDSGRQVFSGFLRVASSNLQIATHQGGISLLPDSYLALRDQTMIDLSRYRRVLVIENGAPMENLTLMMEILPRDYLDATLYVYRGHDASAESMLALIQRLGADQVLGLYFDYDLAGLDMQGKFLERNLACQVQLLFPEHGHEALQEQGREDLYKKQLLSLRRVKRYAEAHPVLAPHVAIVDEERKGVLQEAMLAHEICLRSVSTGAVT